MRLHELNQTNQNSIDEAPVGMLKRAAQAAAGKFSTKQAGAAASSAQANELYSKLKQIAGAAGIDTPDSEQIVKIFAKAGQTNVQQVKRALQRVGFPAQDPKKTWDVIGKAALVLIQAQALDTNSAKIPSELIDAIKKLSGDQKTILGKILLGQG